VERVGRYHAAVGVTSADSPLVPDALTWLRGSWRIERRLADHRSGSAGWFRGTARFEPPAADNSKRPAAAPGSDLAALIYDETGELAFGEHRGPASRRLIYRGRADGTAEVFFADEREFYRLDPRPGRWQARHWCGRDEYLVSGRVLGPGLFEERWHVTGPAKDYEIMTTLTRVDSE
jgi:Family of unknown function (DUF6314)